MCVTVALTIASQVRVRVHARACVCVPVRDIEHWQDLGRFWNRWLLYGKVMGLVGGWLRA
jgi:hypothetical protein